MRRTRPMTSGTRFTLRICVPFHGARQHRARHPNRRGLWWGRFVTVRVGLAQVWHEGDEGRDDVRVVVAAASLEEDLGRRRVRQFPPVRPIGGQGIKTVNHGQQPRPERNGLSRKTIR